MKLFGFIRLSTCILAISLLIGCQKEEKLVVYSGRGEALVAPIFEKFTEKTGYKVDVRYNTTGALATQALAEGSHTPADVFFFQEVGYLNLLKNAELLQTLPNNILERVDINYRDPDQIWVGTSARLRVLAYNTEKLTPADLPAQLKDLTDPKWKGQKLGWAPTNASLQAHISALRHIWGEDSTTEWLVNFKNNEPVSYAKNAEQVLAVARGEILIAWTNHYYLYQLKKQDPNLPVANYSFPTKRDPGNILMISGIGVHKNTQQQKAALAFVEFLLSDEAQHYITQEGFEYPTASTVKANSDLPTLESLDLAPVDQAWLSDVQPTLSLMQKLGIL